MTNLNVVENIWQRPVAGLSNSAISAIYLARTRTVVSQVIQLGGVHPVCVGGRISRKRLAALVGCCQAAVSQNLHIAKEVREADKFLMSITLTPAASRLDQELRDLIPSDRSKVRLSKNSLYSRIVLARFDKECADCIPTIVFADGIHEPSADWLRHFIGEGGAVSSALQYAKTLREFLFYCRRRDWDWKEVDDKIFKQWRERKLKSGVSKGRLNEILSTVFGFYVFCELNGLLRYQVGCYERASLPEKVRHMQFPITAEHVLKGPRRHSVAWTTPLRYRNTPSSIGNRQTPSDDQMMGLHENALEGQNGERNELILAWVEDSGARRSEILQLQVSQLPGKETVDALFDDPQPWLPIDIPHRKGGSSGVLLVSADTLVMTLAYLKQRRRLVEKFKASNPSYEAPAELFLSTKTGQVLKPDSLTNLFKPKFRKVGLYAANIHRVRAKTAVDYVESLIERMLEAGIEVAPGSPWIETILQQASLKLGHKNLGTLRYYITTALRRRIQTAESAVDRAKSRATRNAEVLLRTALKQLGLAERLLDEVKTLARPSSMAAALRGAAAELDALDEI